MSRKKGVKMNHVFVERKEYNNVITVKIVVPTGCNAKCPFCYNNDKDMSCDKKQFLDNFMNSLLDILNKIGDKNPVSVDITGGEPTLDIPLIKEILRQLRVNNIHDRTCRITMTTNGCNLLEIADDCYKVIDYINISIHDYRINERRSILGDKALLTDRDYYNIIKACNKNKIACSAVSVIYKPLDIKFSEWRDYFIDWAKARGFIGLRFRYCTDDEIVKKVAFDDYMLETIIEQDIFKTITHEDTPDSHWCRLRRYDGFRVFFLHGVKDTTLFTKGIEYVVDNDGHCYCDYYKKTPIEKYEYEIGKIYDKI